MRTTLDIADDVLCAVKERARRDKKTTGISATHKIGNLANGTCLIHATRRQPISVAGKVVRRSVMAMITSAGTLHGRWMCSLAIEKCRPARAVDHPVQGVHSRPSTRARETR